VDIVAGGIYFSIFGWLEAHVPCYVPSGLGLEGLRRSVERSEPHVEVIEVEAAPWHGNTWIFHLSTQHLPIHRYARGIKKEDWIHLDWIALDEMR